MSVIFILTASLCYGALGGGGVTKCGDGALLKTLTQGSNPGKWRLKSLFFSLVSLKHSYFPTSVILCPLRKTALVGDCVTPWTTSTFGHNAKSSWLRV